MKLIDRIIHRHAFTAFGPPSSGGGGNDSGGLSGTGIPVSGRIAFWAGETALGHENGLSYDVENQTLSAPRLDIDGVILDGENQLDDPGEDRLIGWADSVSSTAYLAPTNGLEIVGPELRLTSNQRLRAIDFALDGGGTEITTGLKGVLQVPYAGTIKAVQLLADQPGAIEIDIWKDGYANYPPTVSDSITGATPPEIRSGIKSEDTELSGWTTSITAGDILGFNVKSASAITRATLILIVEVS